MPEVPSVAPEKMKAVPQGSVENSGEILSPLQETAERVTEIIGEDIAQSSSTQQTQTQKDDSSEDSQAGSSYKKNEIPSVSVQKKAVKKALEDQTHVWEKQVARLQRKKNFSAAKMELLVKKIREYRALIVSLVHVTKEALESLYKRFVLKR